MTEGRLEASLTMLRRLTSDIEKSLEEGLLPRRYKIHVGECLRVMTVASGRLEEICDPPGAVEEAQVDQLLRTVVEPALLQAKFIREKSAQLAEGITLLPIENMLDDFSVKVHDYATMPMAVRTEVDALGNPSPLFITPPRKGAIPYYVFVDRRIADSPHRWCLALHETAHLVYPESRTKRKAREVFCDLLASRAAGYGYAYAALDYASELDIDASRGDHPSWRMRLEALSREIGARDPDKETPESRIQDSLMRRNAAIVQDAGNAPSFYNFLTENGAVEAIARKRLDELSTERGLTYDGWSRWNDIAMAEDSDDLEGLTPVELANVIALRHWKGSPVDPEGDVVVAMSEG